LAYMGDKNSGRIEPSFLAVGVRDVITCFKVGDDWRSIKGRSVKGFRVVWGSNFALSHRLWWCPYNTLTLSCERV